jgi:hypothetical protein
VHIPVIPATQSSAKRLLATFCGVPSVMFYIGRTLSRKGFTMKKLFTLLPNTRRLRVQAVEIDEATQRLTSHVAPTH